MRKHEYPHTQAELNENQWAEVTEDRYFEMLGALPPAAQHGSAFAVGEALCHTNEGHVVFDCFIELEGKFYAKPHKLKDFKPSDFITAIRKQLAAYDTGYKHGQQQVVSRNINAHVKGSSEWWAWENGYDAGENDHRLSH